MSLSAVPVEILLAILSLLPAASLKSLRLTNSFFAAVTAEVPFMRLHLHFGRNEGSSRWIDGSDDGTQCPKLVERLERLLGPPPSNTKTGNIFNGVKFLKELRVTICQDDEHHKYFYKFCTEIWGRFLSLFRRIGYLELNVRCFEIIMIMGKQRHALADACAETFYSVLARRLQEGIEVEKLSFGSELEYLSLLPCNTIRGLRSLAIRSSGPKPLSQEQDAGSVECWGQNRGDPIRLKMDEYLASVWLEFWKHLGQMLYSNRDSLEEWEHTHRNNGPGSKTLERLLNVGSVGKRVTLDYILDEVPEGTVLNIKKLYSFGGFPSELRNLKKLARLEKINQVDSCGKIGSPAVSVWTQLRETGIKLRHYESDETSMTAEYLEYLEYASSSRPGGMEHVQIPNIKTIHTISALDDAAAVFNHGFTEALATRTLPAIRNTVTHVTVDANIVPVRDTNSMELVTPLLSATPLIQYFWEEQWYNPGISKENTLKGTFEENPSDTFAQVMEIFRVGWNVLETLRLEFIGHGSRSCAWSSNQLWKRAYTSKWSSAAQPQDTWNEKLKVTVKYRNQYATWGLKLGENGAWRLNMEKDKGINRVF